VSGLHLTPADTGLCRSSSCVSGKAAEGGGAVAISTVIDTFASMSPLTHKGTGAEQAVSRLKALADEKRLKILALLAGGERCVCHLQEEMDIAQPLLSFHLRKLKEAGLVTDRPHGRWVHYSLNTEALEELRAFLGMMEAPEGRTAPSSRWGA